MTHGYFPVSSFLGVVRPKNLTSLYWKCLMLHHICNTKICISRRN